MITIRITNVDHIVLEKKGWFVAHVVGAFVDLQAQVDAHAVLMFDTDVRYGRQRGLSR
jgi:hypothetical protein